MDFFFSSWWMDIWYRFKTFSRLRITTKIKIKVESTQITNYTDSEKYYDDTLFHNLLRVYCFFLSFTRTNLEVEKKLPFASRPRRLVVWVNTKAQIKRSPDNERNYGAENNMPKSLALNYVPRYHTKRKLLKRKNKKQFFEIRWKYFLTRPGDVDVVSPWLGLFTGEAITLQLVSTKLFCPLTSVNKKNRYPWWRTFTLTKKRRIVLNNIRGVFRAVIPLKMFQYISWNVLKEI